MAVVYSDTEIERIHSTRSAVKGRLYKSLSGVLYIGTDKGFLERSKELRGSVNTETLDNTIATDKYFEFTQSTASNNWEIRHNLNKKPSVMVVDSGDNVVEGCEIYVDNNNLRIEFGAPFTGKAYLS